MSESLAGVREREPEHFATRIVVEDEGPTILWHGDAGYETGDADATVTADHDQIEDQTS